MAADGGMCGSTCSEAEHETVIETRDVLATFSNRGAILKSWRLKRYLDQSRQPLELVVQDPAVMQPRPFSLRSCRGTV